METAFKPEWGDWFYVTEWTAPEIDKHILHATVYLVLWNPDELAHMPKGKAFEKMSDAKKQSWLSKKEQYMCKFTQTTTVPADAPEAQKVAALSRARHHLIGEFDWLYAGQQSFEITKDTVPFESKAGRLYTEVLEALNETPNA